MINIVDDIIRPHGAENIFHHLRLRKGVELLRAMDSRELKD